MKKIYVMLLTALCQGAVMAENAEESVRVDGVAAYVNAHVITYSDVLGASSDLQRLIAQRRGGDAVNARFREALEKIINRKMILDAYADQQMIQIPDEIVDERVQNVIRDMFKNDRMAFLNALAADGQTEAAWREQIREQIVVSAMRNVNVSSQVNVSPVAVRERYNQTQDQQETPPAVRFSMIVIAVGSDKAERRAQKQKLEQVQQALAAGDDFATVARKYSEGSLAEAGGARDWVEPDMLRRELRDLVMKSEIGALKGPVEIGPHYALVIVDDRREGGRRSFADAYGDIERELRMEEEKRLYDEWISRLRRDAFIRVLNENPF